MGTLYFGDNLDILRRYIPDQSIDLIYLDPPFNSAQNYNAFFQEKDDTAAAINPNVKIPMIFPRNYAHAATTSQTR